MLKDFTVKHNFKKHGDTIQIRKYCVFLSDEMLPVCTSPACYSALMNVYIFFLTQNSQILNCVC